MGQRQNLQSQELSLDSLPALCVPFPVPFYHTSKHFRHSFLKNSWNRAVGKPKEPKVEFTFPQRNLKENLAKIPSLSFRSQLYAATPKKQVRQTEVKNTLGESVNVQERVAPGCGGRGCTWFVWGSRSTSGAERTMGDKTVKEG